MTALQKFKAGEWLTNYYQVLGHDTFWVHLNRAPTKELAGIGDCVVHYGQAIACPHTGQKALELSKLVLKLYNIRLEQAEKILAAQKAQMPPVKQRMYHFSYEAFIEGSGWQKFEKYIFVQPNVVGNGELDQQVAIQKFREELPHVNILCITEVSE